MKDMADSFSGLLDPAKDEEEGAPSAPYVYQRTARQYEKNNRSRIETDLERILGMIHLNFQPPANMPNPMSRVLRKGGIRGRLDRGDGCKKDSDEKRNERLLN